MTMEIEGKPFRKHKRHSVALRVHYQGLRGEVEEVVSDISLGGLRISGPIADVPGAPVALTLTLPHLEAPVEVSGEVVWIERDDTGERATVGVRFRDLDPQLNVMLAHIFREGLPE